jgi:glycosyltransferase involved in cell wall biosynthesis
MKEKISVFIITFNEEKIIKKCLEKLHWANEIVVLDSGSTDDTVSICNLYGAKVFFNKFDGFGKQKQLALSHTKNDWVLSLDADEILSDKLIKEIQDNKYSDTISAYNILITQVFLNKKFRFGAENKRPKLRLFNKKYGNFTPDEVHETITIKGKIKSFRNEVLHYTVIDLETSLRKCIQYANLGSELLHKKGKRTTILKPIFKLPFDFFRAYFFQLNFLNGYQGFVWSLFVGISGFLKYANLYEKQKR